MPGTPFLQAIISGFIRILPAWLEKSDLPQRLLMCALVIGIHFLLQEFEGRQRRIMRDLLSSYKYSGLMAFKSVWDELDRGSENPHGGSKLPRLRAYSNFTVLLGSLIAFSLYRRLTIPMAVITGVLIPFIIYPVQLHLILKWFYNNKPYPVNKNVLMDRIALCLYNLFLLPALGCLSVLYSREIRHFAYLKFIIPGAIVFYFAAGIFLSGGMINSGTKGRALSSRVNWSFLIFVMGIPFASAFLLQAAFMKVPAAALCTFLHSYIYLPEILFPALCLICMLAWNAAGSYLGRPLPSVPNRREELTFDREKSFLGEE